MHRWSLIAAALLPLAAAAQEPASSAVVGDLCTPPAAGQVPATTVYHLENGGTVVFVAVLHTHDPHSATFAQLQAAFARYRPNLVLIEGADAARNDSEAYRAFLAERAARQQAAGTLQENLYALTLAAAGGIRYGAWDLSPHDEYVGDIARGYAIDDAIGAHLLRAHLDPFATPAPERVQAELAAVPQMRRPAAFDYAGWYRQHYGDVFHPGAGTPCSSGIAARIVRDESIRRTARLAQLIGAEATRGTTILVEAGAAHWLALRDHLASLSTSVT